MYLLVLASASFEGEYKNLRDSRAEDNAPP